MFTHSTAMISKVAFELYDPLSFLVKSRYMLTSEVFVTSVVRIFLSEVSANPRKSEGSQWSGGIFSSSATGHGRGLVPVFIGHTTNMLNSANVIERRKRAIELYGLL
ncbi:hypothetical protein AVEN_77373-1 [Araneus ventricosus]|uniref:Uncharacterized protein n=1 Tax=Araneus ventricosus TaxID=182803 RepID=A0A4Y2CA66_ARAVE|nr:hypothetical protein AVEN_77373-1 [Araneus ventricosus]